jgi:hypothetical protein
MSDVFQRSSLWRRRFWVLDPVEFFDIIWMDMALHLEQMVVCSSAAVLGVEICLGSEP